MDRRLSTIALGLSLARLKLGQRCARMAFTFASKKKSGQRVVDGVLAEAIKTTWCPLSAQAAAEASLVKPPPHTPSLSTLPNTGQILQHASEHVKATEDANWILHIPIGTIWKASFMLK